MRKALLIVMLVAAISSCRLYDSLFKGDVVARAGTFFIEAMWMP